MRNVALVVLVPFNQGENRLRTGQVVQPGDFSATALANRLENKFLGYREVEVEQPAEDKKPEGTGDETGETAGAAKGGKGKK